MTRLEFANPEGATPLDPDEAEDLVPEHITTMAQLNEWEQTNILQAEQWLFSRKRRDLLTEPFVRALHRRMFDVTWTWAGRYRLTAKNIGIPASQIPLAVRDTCDDVTYWVTGRVYDLDEIAVRLHHRLVLIHPFSNGNGRHTRLMADALLFQHGAPRFSWGSTDLQRPGTARTEYLAALRAADAGDFTALLRFARN